MRQVPSKSSGRTALVLGVLLLVALTVGTGPALAHNPAGHQTAGEDGPHYDGDERTGSEQAWHHNPTLNGSDHPDHSNSMFNREGGCSVGNSQSPHYDCGPDND